MHITKTCRTRFRGGALARFAAFLSSLAVYAALGAATAGPAAALGSVQGRVIAADNGEPLSFADVLLIPADSTKRRIGGLTQFDGTFRIDAPAGLYSLQVRALSYARKTIEGVRVADGQVFTLTTSLASEAIQQEEVVVEARLRRNTESALLQQRQRSASVEDAVSLEQIRRAPDKDAGEVLQRVTGTTVADGKYVFVRGLGERYSSTEIDGVRLSSPEVNKRVVPLDLLPANLLDHIVVQKTYSADRPAEFGGGDVQVQTRDFPGRRTLSATVSQSVNDATFDEVPGYGGSPKDAWALGAGERELPALIREQGSARRLAPGSRFDPTVGYPDSLLKAFGRSFRNEWVAGTARAVPSGSYALVFGDEWKLAGRALGLVATGTLARSMSARDEESRLFRGDAGGAPEFDYRERVATDETQIGSVAALSARLAPLHTLHVRTFFSRSAEDETRLYEGRNANTSSHDRSTRLRYVERGISTQSLRGKHEFRRLAAARLQWTLSLSQASEKAPDRREMIQERYGYVDDDDTPIEAWRLKPSSGSASREFGELAEDGRGAEASLTLPLHVGTLGHGKLETGWSWQHKSRDHFARRFFFEPGRDPGDNTLPADELFAPGQWTPGVNGARIGEYTYPDDNYEAFQKQVAGWVSVEVPVARGARISLGVRAERGQQQVRNFDLFTRRTVSEGRLDDVDLLPAASLTLSPGERLNVRLAASRTLSRPDLREMSPTRAFDYVGGLGRRGNPNLRRASLENYDARVETFPGLGEVFAAGAFYKILRDPIEELIRGAETYYYEPANSPGGHNAGIELEARASLGRLWSPLAPFLANLNASFIRSRVDAPPSTTVLSASGVHPLQGQADRIVNASLTWQPASRSVEVTALVNHTGRRLRSLGVAPIPDEVERPATIVDLTLSARLPAGARIKFGARNLGDEAVVREQGDGRVKERYAPGRAFSMAISLGQ